MSTYPAQTLLAPKQVKARGVWPQGMEECMKRALWLGAVLLMLAGCSQPTSSSFLSEDAAASATTTSKTGVSTWAIRGSSRGVEVKGQSSANKALQDLKLSLNTDQSCDIVKTYMDSSGNTVASIAIKLGKDGKELSKTPTGNINDPTLCPDCMNNDLKATDTTVQSAGVHGQLTTPNLSNPCQRAQRRIANAAAAVVTYCYGSVVDAYQCALAQAAYGFFYQDFLTYCGNPFGVSAAKRFWAYHRSRFPAAPHIRGLG